MASKKGKKEKLILVFDEKDRREYITGFRKRKNERRKKAKEELRKKEEEKIKQTRAEKRKALQSQIEENQTRLDDMNSDQEDADDSASITRDFGEHTVTVSTITNEDMGPALDPIKYRDQSEQVVKNNEIITTTSRQVKKKQFRRKAQKRKIQGLSDKKKFKHRKLNSNKKKT